MRQGTLLPLDLPRRRFTVDEVLRMVQDGILHEDEPLELLEGDLVLVSPQGPAHASHLTALLRRISLAYERIGHVRPQLPLDLRPHNLPGPDLAVVKGDPRDYRERHPTGRETILLIEIAQTSQELDRRKASIYAAAGVPAYWLIDLPQARLEVHTGAADLGGYRDRQVLAPGEQVDLPQLSLHWPVADVIG